MPAFGFLFYWFASKFFPFFFTAQPKNFKIQNSTLHNDRLLINNLSLFFWPIKIPKLFLSSNRIKTGIEIPYGFLTFVPKWLNRFAISYVILEKSHLPDYSEVTFCFFLNCWELFKLIKFRRFSEHQSYLPTRSKPESKSPTRLPFSHTNDWISSHFIRDTRKITSPRLFRRHFFSFVTKPDRILQLHQNWNGNPDPHFPFSHPNDRTYTPFHIQYSKNRIPSTIHTLLLS